MAEEQPEDGVPDPFEDLLDQYGSVLRGAIARVCPRNLGLEFDDIEQEARLRLWRALQSETEIEKPASYLYRVAVTATLDAVRRAVARREEQLRLSGREPGNERPAAKLDPESPVDSPEVESQRRILLQKVRATLAGMTADRRRAVGLHIRGFTPAEIGRMLSWSEARARSQVYRGLKELRRKLASEGIEYEGS